MRVRSLPIRVDPVAGESIQSWLRMLAHRNEVTWTQILQAVGLHSCPGDGRRTRWSQRLHDHEISALAYATGIEPATLTAMTLVVFDGIGISTGRRPRTPDYGALHGLRSRSRYCPACLDDSGGRWQLRWHLGYTFLCPVHHVVLADTCPACGHPPHPRQPTALSIPQPLRCEHRVRRDGRSVSCGADLRSAPETGAPLASPAMMIAQRVLDDVIDQRHATFGVYKARPAPAAAALQDVRVLATRLLPRLDLIANLAGLPPAGGPDTSANATTQPTTALRTAVAVSAAVEVLSATDAHAAGQRLWPLLAATRADGRTASVSSVINSRRCTSATLTQVQLHATAPWLNPTDLLRYRIADHPQVPHRPAATLARSVRGTPALLWPAIALRLCGDGLDLRAVRAALSVSVALVGSREPLRPIARMLGEAISARAVSHVWTRMRETPHWEVIQQSVIRIADYVRDHRTPIDYQRRRTLDYADLLPDAQWNRICRTTDSSAGRPAALIAARTTLFARITGSAVDQAPWFLRTARLRGQLATFAQHLTPLLRQQLDAVAADFLTHQRITEPVTWAPPMSLLDGLDLPGTDPATVDVDHVHRLLTRPGATISRIAREIEASPDLVCYLLDISPRPPTSEPLRGNQMRRLPGLSSDTLTQLHHDQARSLSDLARRHDLSRQTLTRIATTLGVRARPVGATPRPRRSRDWLAHQYLIEHRTIPEIAGMAGVSASTVSRWMRHYGIGARPRGSRSHGDVGAAHRAAPSQAALLRPALLHPGGQDRLQRFATAMQHRTLTAAAHALDTSEPVLSQQFRRLEAELGRPLYRRAQRGESMRPSEFGYQVLTAIGSNTTPHQRI